MQVLNLSLRQKCFQLSTHAKESVTLMLLCHALTKGWHIQTWFDFRPTWETIFSNEVNSKTAIDNAQQTHSASCIFVCFGSETETGNDASRLLHRRR